MAPAQLSFSSRSAHGLPTPKHSCNSWVPRRCSPGYSVAEARAPPTDVTQLIGGRSREQDTVSAPLHLAEAGWGAQALKGVLVRPLSPLTN